MPDARYEEEVEYLINADIGGRENRALQAALPEAPATARAARCIREAVADGGTVLLTTGFPIRSADAAETDGPPGAVVLARAVEELGGRPVFCVDRLTEPVLTDVAAAMDVAGRPIETVPVDRTAARRRVRTLLESYDPVCCLAVERPGRCADGTYRNMAAEDVSELAGKVDELFELAADAGVPTVGIGDGGNEIGMGCVGATVADAVEDGSVIAAETRTDVLVVAGVSNWGAYGVVAALSLQTDRQLLHDGETERQLIRECVAAGAVDGVAGAPQRSVDGLDTPMHVAMVNLLGGVVDDAGE